MKLIKKIRKNLKYIIPCILIIGVAAYALVHLKIRGLPEEGSVQQDVVSLLEEASKDHKMLTIHGEGTGYSYEWFYNKGAITSFEPTDLSVTEVDTYKEEIKEALNCSLVFGFQLRDSFRLNGYPTLTMKLSDWNCVDCKLYRYENGSVMEYAVPAVNYKDGKVSASFTVSDIAATYYLAAGFLDTSDQKTEAAQSEEEPSYSNQFLQGGTAPVENKQTEETQQTVDASESEGNKTTETAHVDEVKEKIRIPVGDDQKTEPEKSIELPDHHEKKQKKKQKKEKIEQPETNAEELHLNTNLTYIKRPEKVPSVKPSVTEKEPLPEESSKTVKKASEYTKDQKPTSSVTELDGYGKKRLYSDGSQKGKDSYKTDPVPQGKPLPVEPEHTKINYEQSHVCTLSVDVLTLVNSQNVKEAKKKYIPENGYIFNSQQVLFYEGESVYDVLKREMEKAGIAMEVSWTPGFNSVYVEGIQNLYEFDGGKLSGWMYEVNGWFPNYGCSRYLLQEGDDIRWRYTCDLGRDVGCDWDVSK